MVVEVGIDTTRFQAPQRAGTGCQDVHGRQVCCHESISERKATMFGIARHKQLHIDIGAQSVVVDEGQFISIDLLVSEHMASKDHTLRSKIGSHRESIGLACKAAWFEVVSDDL